MHVHAAPGIAADSSASCLICISVHANAATVTVSFVEVLFAVEIIAVSPETDGEDIGLRLELFSRPPPFA